MPPMTPARRVMLEHQIERAELATIIRVPVAKLSRYITGERSMSDEAHKAICAEYGMRGYELSSVIIEARKTYVATHPFDKKTRVRKAAAPKQRTAPKASAPKPATPRRSTCAPGQPDKDWDGKLYAWDEWKRLFPEHLNKTGVDETGRILDTFPTEPCFLGE